ncbi:MAG: hypothetical protein GEU79_04065 [Acidimicrobiia bacterium]|nr:hypothetical protein [Acidimicrobiia bacterium]
MHTSHLVAGSGLLAASLLAIVSLPAVAPPSPVWEERPAVTAVSHLVFDAERDIMLEAQRPDEERAMASTTKMMTAIVAIEEGNLDDEVLVSQEAAEAGEAEVDLVPGEVLPLRDLVTAMVVRSANDAAIAIAEHVAGSTPEFVGLMNTKAEELGLTRTNFANPHGLDEENHYTSARDLLTLGRYVMENEIYREMAALSSFELPPSPADGEERVAVNTNLMLEDFRGTTGIKTGFTSSAGRVFVGSFDRPLGTMYSVVMGSDEEFDHFEDTRALVSWAYSKADTAQRLLSGGEVHQGALLVEADPLQRTASAEMLLALAADGVLGEPSRDPEPPPVITERGGSDEVSLTDAALWPFRNDP